MLYGIAAAITALLLTAALAALLRRPALRLGRAGSRRRRAAPPAGGPALVLGTCLVAAAGRWTGAAPLGPELERVLTAAAAVAVLGLVADVRRVRTRFLAAGTAVAAACVVPYGETGVPGGLLAVGWITFVALAFRALDHADALAGTVGVLTAFGVAACAAAEVMEAVALLMSVLAAALAGFLIHNWPPARVGLGACGALFTGFLPASAAVFTRAGHGLGSSAGVLFALTAVAGADVLLVVLSRRLAGRALSRGGPDHLGHRLRRLGLTAQGVTVVLGIGAFAGVLVGVLTHLGRAESGVFWVAAVAVVAVLVLLRVPVYGVRGPRETREVTSSQVTRRLRVRNG
ncbi:MraY family glycosyltransferase [Streptomyces sp. NPDC000987]|uniref:MraY family glycosyltransferase n=1 Tax=Streptomyces sp. NPDC000987 TaxID=3154374 RepID=UPI00332237E9